MIKHQDCARYGVHRTCSNRMKEYIRFKWEAVPGVLVGVLDDHGGGVLGRERVAAEGVAPGEVARRKHAAAVADDDALRVQQRHQRVGRPEHCARQLDYVLCSATPTQPLSIIIIRRSANPKPEVTGHTRRASAVTTAGHTKVCYLAVASHQISAYGERI